MKRLLMMILCVALMVLVMPQAKAKDYWVYSDQNGHTYCDSNSLQWDSDGRYCEVRTKFIASDGTRLNPETWLFYKKNDGWYYSVGTSPWDGEPGPLNASVDRRGARVLAWCRSFAGK